MPNSKTMAIVRKCADLVAEYAKRIEDRDWNRKVGNALKGVADAIGADGSIPFTIGEADTLDVPAETFAYYAEVLLGSTTGLMEFSVEVNNSVKDVETLVRNELLEKDELDIATQTLTLWENVRISAKSPAKSTRENGERLSKADIPFAIDSTCDVCNKVVVKGGERSGRLDWNSLRHYSQKHAIDAHGTNTFTNLVSDAWAEAKKAFKSEEITETHIPGDVDMPGFTLVRR